MRALLVLQRDGSELHRQAEVVVHAFDAAIPA
jgi:hypothetical protein